MQNNNMVRFMAEAKCREPADLKRYNRLGYVYREELSTEREYVFERMEA